MEHIVKRGESLWSIAEKYFGSGSRYQDLMKQNNLSEDSVIHPGQKLIIGPDKPKEYKELDTHWVAQGETLSSIASRYGTTVQDLSQVNQNRERFKLYEKYFKGGKLVPRSKFISKLYNNFND